MSKQKWMVCAFALLVIVFVGVNQVVLTADTTRSKSAPSCETVDEAIQDAIDVILHIFEQEDYDTLTNRVNELASSKALLENEIHVLEIAVCLNDVYNDKDENALLNGYHSLLLFLVEVSGEEDLQFEEIVFSKDEIERILHVEGILKDTNKEVTIDHYYSYHVMSGYLGHENRLRKEQLQKIEEHPAPLLLTISEGLASSAYAVIQNPIESFMMWVDSYFTGKAELETEIFEKESLVNASYFNVGYSAIIFGENTWDPLHMVEYYPSTSTYETIERAKEVLEEFPDYWYPKDAIEQKDWKAYVTYYENHRMDMYEYSYPLYEYIFGGVVVDSETYEELIRKEKAEKGIRD